MFLLYLMNIKYKKYKIVLMNLIIELSSFQKKG